MRCPGCGKKLKLVERDAASVAVGSFLAAGDVYRCKSRHVWVWCDPPAVNLEAV